MIPGHAGLQIRYVNELGGPGKSLKEYGAIAEKRNE